MTRMGLGFWLGAIALGALVVSAVWWVVYLESTNSYRQGLCEANGMGVVRSGDYVQFCVTPEGLLIPIQEVEARA